MSAPCQVTHRHRQTQSRQSSGCTLRIARLSKSSDLHAQTCVAGPRCGFRCRHRRYRGLQPRSPDQKAGLNPRTDLESPAITATVTGWGVTADGNPTDTLQRAELPVVSEDACKAAYANIGLNVSPNTLCAGYAKGEIDACTGDSGGPLILTNEGQLVGIISWGKARCNGDGQPGVYTRVAAYAAWIQQAMMLDKARNSLP